MESCLMKSKILATIYLMTSSLFATEIFYYGNNARNLEVNSTEETLLIFPSPPVAQICHPSNTLQMLPVDHLSQLQALSMPQGSEYLMDGSTQSPILANFLKLIPLKEESANCSVKLSNGESINIIISPQKSIQRPLIEFKSIHAVTMNTIPEQESLSLFKEFVGGGKLTSFREISPSSDTAIKSTKIGDYKIFYLATNNQFNAWIFNFYPKELPESFELKKSKVGIGEIFFSALVNKKDQTHQIYILSRSDISIDEMMEKLP